MLTFLLAVVICIATASAALVAAVAYLAPRLAPVVDELVYAGFSFINGEAPDIEPRDLRRWLFSMDREALGRFLDDRWNDTQDRDGSVFAG